MRIKATNRLRLGAFIALGAASLQARAAEEPTLGFAGAPAQVVYNARTDHCAPIDTPDISPTAFRDANGQIVMFALHYINRVLRGADFGKLKIDCNIVLNSSLDADPSRYDDRRYMGSSWSSDGKRVTSIVHHEYHAETHNTCSHTAELACWYNTILSFSSSDGGASFKMDKPAVVAAVPFRQDVGQGRHRGFFSPSNIVAHGGHKYFFTSTTGFSGQNFGVCLFRAADPHDSASWRAWDGKEFSIRYDDPYSPGAKPPKPCAIIEPFLYPVSSFVRHRASGTFIAVWMGRKNDKQFPVDGFYFTTSRDLKTWGLPRLLRAGPTIHDIPCTGSLIGYPSLLDETAQGRNFDDVGDAPWLFFTRIESRGCGATGNRVLVRERMKITLGEGAPR